jgi:hypothetical protein
MTTKNLLTCALGYNTEHAAAGRRDLARHDVFFFLIVFKDNLQERSEKKRRGLRRQHFVDVVGLEL